ncbi:MAG TPA: hypothetical protein VIU61_12220 [Kofleriaceae bacterium]
MRRLRRLLGRAVFLGVAATQNGCCCPEEELPVVDVELARSSPEIAALIDRCEANPEDCEPLCRAALEAEFADEAQYYLIVDCDVTVQAPGALVHVGYDDASSCGRAPSSLLACERSNRGDALDRWLARAAYLEAASVAAFVQLAADLVHHRAPRALVAAAIAAARDEVRHAAVMRGLVRGRVEVPVPRVARYRPASLRELAIVNASEGCARETLGAAINLWQARCARDPEIREAFTRIAGDEIAHAELAWSIHEWVLTQLDPAEIDDVLGAHRSALARVVEDLELDPATRDALGLPDRDETCALAAALHLKLPVEVRKYWDGEELPVVDAGAEHEQRGKFEA